MAARLSDAEKQKRERAKADKQAKRDKKKADREAKKADKDKRKADREAKKADKDKRKADRDAKKADREKGKADRAKKKADREKKKTERGAKTTDKKKVAGARKERKILRKDLRQGERRATTTYRTGNAGCRTTRRTADAPHKAVIKPAQERIRHERQTIKPHREAMRDNRVDYDKCRRAVEGRTVEIVSDLAPIEQRLRALDALIPAPTPNYRAKHRQEQWSERLDQARAEVISQHPELSGLLDQFLDPLAKYGSRASKEVRAEIDQLVQGRPVMRLDELVLQKAHDAGWSPTSGLRGAPSLQATQVSQAEDSVRRLLAHGPPMPPGVAEQLVESLRGGPSSAVAPSRVTPSALTFPPVGSSSTHQLIEQARNATPPSRPGARRGTPPSRPRGQATGARRGAAKTRAPRTQASPGSKPTPKKKSGKAKGARK